LFPDGLPQLENKNDENTQTPGPDRLRLRTVRGLYLLQRQQSREERVGLRHAMLRGRQDDLRHLPGLQRQEVVVGSDGRIGRGQAVGGF
jgi:hypothetical protein